MGYIRQDIAVAISRYYNIYSKIDLDFLLSIKKLQTIYLYQLNMYKGGFSYRMKPVHRICKQILMPDTFTNVFLSVCILYTIFYLILGLSISVSGLFSIMLSVLLSNFYESYQTIVIPVACFTGWFCSMLSILHLMVLG